MLIHICRKKLLNIPNFNSSGKSCILSKIKRRMYTVKNCNNYRMRTATQISPTFFNEQCSRHSRAMNNRIIDNKIAITICRTICNRSTMNFK